MIPLEWEYTVWVSVVTNSKLKWKHIYIYYILDKPLLYFIFIFCSSAEFQFIIFTYFVLNSASLLFFTVISVLKNKCVDYRSMFCLVLLQSEGHVNNVCFHIVTTVVILL